MALSRSSLGTISFFAGLATIASAGVAIMTAFFPDVLNTAAKQAIDISQFRTEFGTIRPAIVSAQINIFVFAAIAITAVIGSMLSSFYTLSTVLDARSVATGAGNKKLLRWISLILVFVMCLSLGVTLPKAIFVPTDIGRLTMDFGIGAWAIKSWLGGVVLGLIGFVIASAFAALFFYACMVVPINFKKTKFDKAIPSLK